MLTFHGKLLHFLTLIVVLVVVNHLLLSYHCLLLQMYNIHCNLYCLVSLRGINCMLRLGNNHIYVVKCSCFG
jgi:hypothetical protein